MDERRNVLLSVISPAYNEEDNIIPLVEAFDNLRKKLRYGMELIIVDDGSKDKTAERARALKKDFRFVKIVSYSANKGKTFAVQRGLDIAEGKYIVIFDADLQFDPNDIPPMIDKLDRGADLVAGYKVGKYQKPLVSKIYNLFGKILFRVPVRDMNAMKAMRRSVLEAIPFRPDWHRYIVVWAHKNGFKIEEHPVKLRPRKRGKSKYRGIGRIFIGTFDMLSVWFQLTFARRPMLFFGTAGIFTFALALVIGIIALVLRYGYGIGFRPLLTLIAMLANIGLLLLIGGFLGEIIEGLRDKVNRIEKTPQRQERTAHERKPAFKKHENNYRKTDNRDRKPQREPRRNSQHRDRKPPERKPKKYEKSQNTSKHRNADNAIVSTKSEQIKSDEIESKDSETKAEMSWGRKKRKGVRK